MNTKRQYAWARALLAVAVLAVPGSADGQSGGEGGGGGGVPGTHRVVIPMTETGPRIDGVMDTGEWRGATRLSDFTQVDPDEGSPATERTEVFLTRDARALYVAFVAYDKRMSGVRSVRKPRDRWIAGDDAVAILVDPFQSRTRAFVFQANPLGVQSDGIWSRQWDWGWDGMFESRGEVYDDHYVVEMAIPLATLLGASSGRDTWDVNFTRWIARKNERSWWAPLKRDELNALLTRFGEVSGMGEVRSRNRVEVIPTLTGRGGGASPVGQETGFTQGVTVRVPALAWLRATATYRPDFSFVESDVPQMAFNERYALFYPEKRPFFQEGQDQFQVPAASYDSDPLQLLHTRTITRPRVGARVLASPGDYFLGGLLTTQDGLDGSSDGSSLALRASRRWQNSSQIGFLASRRTFGKGGDNVVVSGDAQIRLPASTLFTVQAARSASTDEVGVEKDALALYVDLAREGANTFQQVVYRRVPTDFEASLGFIPRTDVQQVVGHVGAFWRTKWMGVVHALPMYQVIANWDDGGTRVDVEHLPHLEMMLLRATKLWLAYRFGDERFRDRFHQMGRWEVRAATSPAPWMDVSVEGKTGTRIRYDSSDGPDRTFVGSYRAVSGGLDFKVGRGGEISGLVSRASYGASADMPEKSLLLWRLRATMYFDNERFLRVISQRDPDTELRFDSVLFGWEVDRGTQLHIGVERGVGPNAASPRKELTTFMRFSYLLGI